MQTTTGKRTALSLLFSLAIGLAFGAASPAHAQAFPNKPITLVVPYTPGGTTDNIVRAIQAKFGEQLGQPIVIDNRPGASGNVGNRSVARAAPEGYTVGIMPTTVGTFPLMGQNLGYDPLADFSYVGTIAETPSILLVRKDSPVRTFADLVSLARTKPGGITSGRGASAARVTSSS